MTLPRGLYDQAITDALTPRIATLPAEGVQVDSVSGDEATRPLLDVLGRSLERIVQELPGTDAERVAAELTLVNELLVTVRSRVSGHSDVNRAGFRGDSVS